MPQRSRRLLLLAPISAAWLLAGCGDDPTCVFTTGCDGSSGGPGPGDAATLPINGQTILSGQPQIRFVLPDNGNTVASTAPIMVVFSESMEPATTEGKIKLVQLDVGGFPLVTVPTSQALAAGGRVLFLLPGAPLPPADYSVEVDTDADLFDLTGQRVALSDEAILATFQVDLEDSDEPDVIGTFPEENEVAPATPIVIVAFDRPMNAATVTADSFIVEVEGVPPVFDPVPIPLTVQTAFVPIVDTRVFIWQSIDGAGVPQSLGTSQNVVVTLSPTGEEIEDLDGGELPLSILGFRTQPIDAPLSAVLLSDPADGIGIKNLTPGDPEELALQVDLPAAEPGDVVNLTLFGHSKDVEEGEPPVLVAVERTKTAEGVAPITAVSFSLAELDLATDPGVGLFADGPLAFACALRRGDAVTPLRLLDVDPATGGVQDARLDTVAPVIEELFLPGGGVTAEFRSDLRDLALAGSASEIVRSVEVVTPLGDNGALPPAVGSDDDGLFIAAPIPLGLVAGGGPVTYDVTVYDAVFNASATVSGVFTQHGAVGGAPPFTPGQPIAVEVVDGATLLPLAGALVATHADDGATFPAVDSDTTAPDGTAAVDSAAVGGTILTVQALDHDVWTFHGVAAGRVSVVLRPTVPEVGAIGGVVTTTSDLAELTLANLHRVLDDARRPAEALPTFPGEACLPDPLGTLPLACPFGPEPVATGRLGALSFLAGNFELSEPTFSASALLQAFDLAVPGPVSLEEKPEGLELSIPFLLTEPGVDSSELPIDPGPTVFAGTLATGLDLGDLADNFPRVTVEALVPGVPGSVAVGLGLSYDRGFGNVWDVRSAFAGAVAPGGYFALRGTVDPDPFLRAELRDSAGNRAGQRPRLSALAGLPVPNGLFAPPVPVVSAPALGATVTTPAFEVVFANALPDATGEPGLYVVRLLDSAGRGWDLLLSDPPNGVPAAVHVPDLLALGGARLATGDVLVVVEGYSWPGFDAAEFLFTDAAREHDYFSAGAPLGFDYQP